MTSLLISDYIHKEKNVPEEVCKKVIDITRLQEWTKHVWNDEYGSRVDVPNQKELEVLYAREEFESLLIPFVVEAIGKYCDKYSQYGTGNGWNITSFNPIRLNKYGKGTLMLPHVDHIKSMFDGKNKGIPVLSVVGCLNDDYEGGELVFFENHKIKLNCGDIVVFPSCFLFPHQVSTVTKGVRYSFVSWAW
jgi:hypothetical protein